MKNKYFGFAVIFCLFAQSCAVLDKTVYFKKTDSSGWKLDTPYFPVSLFENCQKWDQRSYSYTGENDTTIIYPRVQYVEFLWTPVFIPLIPGLSPLSSSGKHTNFAMAVQQKSNVFPDNMQCFINGGEAYPDRIELGFMNGRTAEVFWRQNYWQRSDNKDSLYVPPDNWGIFEPAKKFMENRLGMIVSDADKHSNELRDVVKNIPGNYQDTSKCYYLYHYRGINQKDMQNMEIHFKNKCAEPICLKRKKGLKYELIWFLFPVYR
jgi:hypothetical protein